MFSGKDEKCDKWFSRYMRWWYDKNVQLFTEAILVLYFLTLLSSYDKLICI